MISIVICSVNKELLSRLVVHIEDTIGAPYEVIAIDNSANRYGICRAYNEGADRARYPILCFMHEDISFETRDWGQKIIRHLDDPGVGLLGVAGGDAKSRVPSSWSLPVGSNHINLVQHYKHQPMAVADRIRTTSIGADANRARVIAVDGVWLCTRKDVFDQFRFDERLFPGFHGYDIDYSLQVGTKYHVYVVFDVLIHHYSEGRPDRKWMESACLVSKKWKHLLPLSVQEVPENVYFLHHWHAMHVFLWKLSELNYNYVRIVYYLCVYSFSKYFKLRRFLSMWKYTIECQLGKRGSQ